jgi:hypothetical protein
MSLEKTGKALSRMKKIGPHSSNTPDYTTWLPGAFLSGMKARIFRGTRSRAGRALGTRSCSPSIIFYYFIFHGRLHKK